MCRAIQEHNMPSGRTQEDYKVEMQAWGKLLDGEANEQFHVTGCD